MLFIVSGHQRSGTTMMVNSLSAGGRPYGLRVAWSAERDQALNDTFADEHFQPNAEYMEVEPAEYKDLNFPLMYDGHLVKIMMPGLAQMRRIPHRIVLMTRDPMAINESAERAFGRELSLIVGGVKVPASQAPHEWANKYWERIKSILVAAETRPDCQSIHVFRYEQVVAAPRKHFEQLKRDGWPIDVDLAGSVVDPKRKRVNHHGISS